MCSFMRKKNLYQLFCLAALCLLAACSTSREVVYFQDLRPGESEQKIDASYELRLRPKDKISILVNSRDQQLTNLFNLPYVSRQLGQTSATGLSNTSQGVSAYTLDNEGCIDFPVLGRLKLAGKTREEVAAYIKEELVSQNLVKDPVVTVEFVNLSISVLGEVNKPGVISLSATSPPCSMPSAWRATLPSTASATRCWCFAAKKVCSVSTVSTSVPLPTSIPHRSTTCSRTMSFTSSPMRSSPASPRSTVTMSVPPRSGFP